MSQKPDSVVELSDTLTLCEFKSGGDRGFWLYDETRGMNLAMKATTEREAFVETLTYYQERLARIESAYFELKKRVDDFVINVREKDDDDDDCF